MIPKSRLDALTDGVFAVAMTLLVIDLRLPDNFHPQDASELLHRVGELGNQMLVYVISFFVLSRCWLGSVSTRRTARAPSPSEHVSERYTHWALFYLLLITFVPFATMLIGRYPSLAPAVWIYATNMILIAVVAVRMLMAQTPGKSMPLEARVGLTMLIVAAVLTIVVSLFEPRYALFAYLVNFLDTPARRIISERQSAK